MDRLFLDANVLSSPAHRRGSGLERLWRLQGIELVSSAYAVEEARRNLEEEPQRARLARLVSEVRVLGQPTVASWPEGIDLPAKDRPILQSAVAGRASHLLTGEREHFGRYVGRRLGGVLVLPPGDYLAGRT